MNKSNDILSDISLRIAVQGSLVTATRTTCPGKPSVKTSRTLSLNSPNQDNAFSFSNTGIPTRAGSKTSDDSQPTVKRPTISTKNDRSNATKPNYRKRQRRVKTTKTRSHTDSKSLDDITSPPLKKQRFTPVLSSLSSKKTTTNLNTTSGNGHRKRSKGTTGEPDTGNRKFTRGRRAMFTIQDEKWEPKLRDGIRFISGQYEVGLKTGNKHFQGYLQLDKPVRLKQLQAILQCSGAHCERPLGTPEQCITYCHKEESRDNNRNETTEGYVFGTPSLADSTGKGSRRTDLESIKLAIDSGKSEQYIQDNYFATWCKNRPSLQQYINDVKQRNSPDYRPIHCTVFFGDSGTGKTRQAIDDANKHGGGYYKLQLSSSGQAWFSNYQGEKTLIIDEFYGGCRFNFMLQLLDCYRLQLETKGGHVYAAWDRVIITSNDPPEAWWHGFQNIPQASKEGFMRRIHSVEHWCKAITDEPEWNYTIRRTIHNGVTVNTEDISGKPYNPRTIQTLEEKTILREKYNITQQSKGASLKVNLSE